MTTKAAPSRDESDPDLQDLELAAWPPRASGPRPAAGGDSAFPELDPLAGLAPPRAQPANDPAGASLPMGPEHELDALQAGPVLELDLPQDHPVLLRSQPPRAEGEPARPSQPHPSQPHPSQPHPSQPQSGRPADETRSARALAGYGSAPAGLVGPARYVLHVGRRMRALIRARKELERQTGALARRHEEAEVALGRALADARATADHADLRELLGEVQRAEAELTARSEAAATARAAEQSVLAQLREKASGLSAQLSPFQAAERNASSIQLRCEAELKRKRAQHQRADIELRALSQASLPPPAEHKERLGSELATRAAETRTLEEALEAATRTLGLARRELALRRGSLDAAERELTQRSSEARALELRLDDELSHGRAARDAALRKLAERARGRAILAPDAPELARLAESEHALDALVDKLATYDRALHLYDGPGLVRGLLVWLGLALAVALFFWLL